MTQAGARGNTIAAGGLLVTALLLGGGNWLFPFYRLVVELAAVLILSWFCLRMWQMPQGKSVGAASVLILLVMALLLVQLVPLPPSLWHELPGREIAVSVHAAIGEPNRFAPISLDPEATRDTLAFFIVPVAMFVATIRIGREGQHRLLQVVAAFALLNGLLVIAQFQGFSWLNLYTSYGRPGTGLFANKNHCALFLVASMPAVTWAITQARAKISESARRWIAVAATGFVSLTVFGCLSRAGLALLPIGVALSGLIIAPRALRGRQAGLVLGGFVVAMLLLVLVLPQTAVVSRALSRFDAQSDFRYQFWPVVIQGVKAYFPFGSGLGTFRPVFAALEPLSIVKPTFVNNAHSDYLEIALEAGGAGVALVLGFVVWFVATAVARLRSCRRGHAGFAPVAIAAVGIVELLLHSIVDYPLRTLALSALTAAYCGILAIRPSALDLQEPSCYRENNRRRARTGANRAVRSRS